MSLHATQEVIPEHLSKIPADDWPIHWHAERLRGRCQTLVSDTETVLRFADRLKLTPLDKFYTLYTHIVANINIALHEDILSDVASDLKGKIVQLKEELQACTFGDELANRMSVHLEKYIEAGVNQPNDGFIRMGDTVDSTFLRKNKISVQGIDRYLKNLRPSGADAAVVYFRDAAGARIKLAEYLPPWSVDSNGAAIRYDMMSSTKSVTGLLCFIAEKRNLLNLDQPITEIFCDREKSDSLPNDWKKITPRHLLNQASGLARNIRYINSMHADSLELHLSVALEIEPGTSLRYSNAGTQLLGFVLDAVLTRAGFDMAAPAIYFANQYLLGPLGMTSTSVASLWDRPCIPLTDRGLQSTADDFAKLSEIILNPGAQYGPDELPLLTESEIGRLFRPASKSLSLSGAGELDQDPLQRDHYANCFYLRPYGIATRGTYNTNMDILFQEGLPLHQNGEVIVDRIVSDPCLIFVRQQSDSGIGYTFEDLEELMISTWQKL